MQLVPLPQGRKKSIHSASLFEKDCLGHFCDCRWETHFLLLHVCFAVYLYLISPSPSGHTLLWSPAQAVCVCVCVCVCVVCASFDMASLQSQRKEVGCWEAGWRLRGDQQIKARPVRWMQAGGGRTLVSRCLLPPGGRSRTTRLRGRRTFSVTCSWSALLAVFCTRDRGSITRRAAVFKMCAERVKSWTLFWSWESYFGG